MARDECEILLVEDDPAEVELTLHAFRGENLGNQIHVARDGLTSSREAFICQAPGSATW